MKGRGVSSGSYKNLQMLFIVLLIIGMFGALFASFISFSGNKSMYERFTSPSVSIEYYFKPGCPPCEAFNSVWTDFVETTNKTPNTSYTTEKYDVNDDKTGGSARATAFKINATPTIIAVKDGKKLEFNGDRTKEALILFANSSVNATNYV